METKAYIPTLLGIALALGVWIGSGFQDPFMMAKDESQWQKVEQILQYVENDYVDTVHKSDLEEEMITFLLQKLDPHSYYIPEEDLASMNEPMNGNFEGIGVQFKLENDTIYVIKALVGGPSKKAGVLEGDRIIMVGSDTIAGKGLSNRDVMALLKGPAGSEVNISIKRRKSDDFVRFDIQRDQIPIRSIEAAYRIDSATIYVRIARFAKTTYEEFRDEVYPLFDEGITHFVLDLRGNGGGILDTSIDIADEFISDGKIITYTEGKARPRVEFSSTEKGKFENVRLSVLIDGYSASASEIIAGAVQDLDRGLVIGRRSFGKGLVQEQNDWSDGSATRLTVARYYTPLGRSIQRPYASISSTGFTHAESDTASVGGIVPDVNVKRDTSGVTWFYAELVHRGLLTKFAYHYRDQHLNALRSLNEDEFIAEVETSELARALRDYLHAKELKIEESEWNRSIDQVTNRCKAIIGRSMFDDEIYYRIMNKTDVVVKRALELGGNPV